MAGIEVEITLNDEFVDIQGTEVAEALKTAGLDVDTVWVDGLLYFQKPPVETPEQAALHRDEFLASVVVTAIEGGIGYWSVVHTYRWYSNHLSEGKAEPTERGGDNAEAVIITHDGGEPYHVTPATIVEAFKRLESGAPIDHLSDRRQERLLVAYRKLEGGDIDADDADVLVQLGLFGEVVYG